MKNFIFNYSCDIYRFVVADVNYTNKRQTILKYKNVPCYITSDTDGYFAPNVTSDKNSQLERKKGVRISLPLEKRAVEVGDEVVCEGTKYIVEDVSTRKFASGRGGSILLKCRKYEQ